ncbi:MAG: hypothetical protein IT431_16325 [Phycisphaerales bacterium]|nr:hypothetical protein [Phycisphaerales bacterium]
MPPTPSHFTTTDWLVLLAYLALLVGTGIAFTRRQSGSADYFLAGRRMPVWAVAISILATSLSAATFIGVPQSGFTGNLTYLATNIGMVLAIVLVAVFFIPAFYAHNCTSIYQLLEQRFGMAGRRAAGIAYLFGRLLASSSRIYIGAIPAAIILFGEDASRDPGALSVAIAIFCVIGIGYTLLGGIGAVIWTDVIQTIVFVVAAAAAIVLILNHIPGGAPAAIDALAHDGKLTILDTTASLERPYTIYACILAFTLMGLASYGTDQDMVQRMLTCRNALAGGRSAVLGIVVAVPTILLFLTIGMLLHVFYRRPDIMGDAAPAYEIEQTGKVFVSFILREMPAGLSGLMIAGLVAAGLSSVNSSLNSMANTVVTDFYQPLRPGKPDRHYLVAGRACVIGWGVLMTAAACACVFWEAHTRQVRETLGLDPSGFTLLDFALSVMTFAYAGLLAMFLSAIFTRRGNAISAIAALAIGFLVVLAMQPAIWHWWTGHIPAWAATPTIDDGFRLGEHPPAWPWHLVAGLIAAFTTCQLGAPSNRARSASEGPTPSLPPRPDRDEVAP